MSMFKKIILIFVLIVLVGCTATKPTIITTKRISPNTKTVLAQKSKKPIVTKSPATKTVAAKPPIKNSAVTQAPKQDFPNQVTEVIVSSSQTIVSSDVVVNYIAKFKDIAMDNMRVYGIPASIVLAQGILESGAGRGDLAVNANNHFGIKCHEEWKGETIKHDDDAAQECFRKYDNVSESFKDHAVFLTTRGRYSNLFELDKNDYKAWARGLRAAGYATDPKYPNKLMSYIERYKLDQYDNLVLGIENTVIERQFTQKMPMSTLKNTTRDVTIYQVQKGDTLYSISKKFNLDIDAIKERNNLAVNTLSIGQELKI